MSGRVAGAAAAADMPAGPSRATTLPSLRPITIQAVAPARPIPDV